MMAGLKPAFRAAEAYRPTTPYRLLPFRFSRLDATRYVVTNDVGEYLIMSRPDLSRFAARGLKPHEALYEQAAAKHFLFDDASECAIDLLSLKYRTRAETFAASTSLFMFVVTLRCDHSCHYCQVSRQTEDKDAFDMRDEHAEKALDIVFRTPARDVKIEFQGGEPLLNFGLIRRIVERAVERNREHQKNLAFVIATNLARIDDEMLEFCRLHRVFFSTSLDGPKELHDAHRPLRGRSSYEAAVDGIGRVRTVLGPDSVSALMTTTPKSLQSVRAIIDEYVARGFKSIFLRSLSPYGFAVRTKLLRRYDENDWLRFYRDGLAYVLDLNHRGTPMREEFTAILLQKMFSPRGTGYIDLQSPAGIGIGGLLFNYDGGIYASDEGRMLAEMADDTFRLGHLDTASYDDVMLSDNLLEPLERSLLESAPMCSDCAFLPYCGAEPVFHQATRGEPVGHKQFSAFCAKQMGVAKHVLTLLEDDADARAVLMGWV